MQGGHLVKRETERGRCLSKLKNTRMPNKPPEERREAWNRSSATAFKPPLPLLDLGLLASRARKPQMAAAQDTPFGVLCSQSPSQTPNAGTGLGLPHLRVSAVSLNWRDLPPSLPRKNQSISCATRAHSDLSNQNLPISCCSLCMFFCWSAEGHTCC